MAWNNTWYLVPRDQVDTIVDHLTDPQQLWPHVAYADGGIEGSHFQSLWDLLQGKRVGRGRDMCEKILHIEEPGLGRRKVGQVSWRYILELADLCDNEAEIRLMASLWRGTVILHGVTTEHLILTINEWCELAKRAVAENKLIILEWFC